MEPFKTVPAYVWLFILFSKIMRFNVNAFQTNKSLRYSRITDNVNFKKCHQMSLVLLIPPYGLRTTLIIKSVTIDVPCQAFYSTARIANNISFKQCHQMSLISFYYLSHLMRFVKRSTGNGKIIVEFFSALIEFKVWRYRN